MTVDFVVRPCIQIVTGRKQRETISFPDAWRSKKVHIELFVACRGR